MVHVWCSCHIIFVLKNIFGFLLAKHLLCHACERGWHHIAIINTLNLNWTEFSEVFLKYLRHNAIVNLSFIFLSKRFFVLAKHGFFHLTKRVVNGIHNLLDAYLAIASAEIYNKSTALFFKGMLFCLLFSLSPIFLKKSP